MKYVGVVGGGRRFVGLLALVVLLGGMALWLWDSESTSNASAVVPIQQSLEQSIVMLRGRIGRLEDQQTTRNLRVVSQIEVQNQITAINLSLIAGNQTAAQQSITRLEANLTGWEAKLAAVTANPVPDRDETINLPILLYHKPPADFEEQMRTLIVKGYHTVDLDQLSGAMVGKIALPTKPVIISFDDGFSDQLRAVDILAKYQLKATIYIIIGGSNSHYCLGANRSNQSCGDSYMNWDQIKQLDHRKNITIGAHTVDHLNLADLSPQEQEYEIVASKNELESRLGHQVKHFAYPYGSYTATTERLVREAGFLTAVSTLPGSVHNGSTRYSLHRIREFNSLP